MKRKYDRPTLSVTPCKVKSLVAASLPNLNGDESDGSGSLVRGEWWQYDEDEMDGN